MYFLFGTNVLTQLGDYVLFGYQPKQCRYCSKLISGSTKVSGILYNYCSVAHKEKHEAMLDNFGQLKNPDSVLPESGKSFTSKEK